MTRYANIFNCIKLCKPTKIIEIGTWNGKHACKMVTLAKKLQPDKKISYLGFDLFEDFKQADDEFCPKKPALKELVRKKLHSTNVDFFELIQGNTKDTLPLLPNHMPNFTPADFIYIDGGHSLETVENDFTHTLRLSHEKTIFLFDDYYHDPELGKKYGCRTLIKSLNKDDFTITQLGPIDECNGGTSMVMVTKQ